MRSAAHPSLGLHVANLDPSPVAQMRLTYGLSLESTAKMLGVSVLRLVRLEAATRRLSREAWENIEDAISASGPISHG